MVLPRCDRAQLIRWLMMTLISIVLVIFTGIVNICLRDRVQDTCSHLNKSRHFEDCRSQRLTVFLFIVFCVVRIASYKFEKHLSGRPTKCHAKVTLPGHHVGITLVVPFVVRKVLPSLGVQSAVLLYLITFALSSIAFYPYFKDLFYMGRYVGHAVRDRFYEANQDLILTFIALYNYMSIVMVEYVDISTDLYCSQYFYGLPLLFPNINFPLLLFYLHSLVIMCHKKMPLIVYEVVEEDCFIQVQRMRCICQKDCPEFSHSVRLRLIPSMATTRERQALGGRIVKVRNLHELESNLPVKA